jgi:aryl-alcohol dehydrogenase
MHARTAVLHDAGADPQLTDVTIWAPVEDEVLVRTMAKGLRVRGVVEGDSDPHTFIPRLAELCRTGDLPVGKLVTTFDLDSFGEAWAAAKAGRVVKPVLLAQR